MLPSEVSFQLAAYRAENFGEMTSVNNGSATLKRLAYTGIEKVIIIAQYIQKFAGKNQMLIAENRHKKSTGISIVLK